MDPVDLALKVTGALSIAAPYIVNKVEDILLEEGIKKLGSKYIDQAKVLLDKIRSKESESIEIALEDLSKNSEDLKAQNELQQGILKLLTENPKLSWEIEPIVINFDVANINQLTVGNYNTFFYLNTPSGEELIKIIEYLNQKRKEIVNQEILTHYNLSTLLYYPEKLKQFVTQNRVDYLKKTLIYLEDHRILLICGVGGVGKSTLARALVDFRPVNVPEPFWFSFYDNQDAKLGDILEKLAAYMKAPEIAAFKLERREPGKIDVDRLTGELHRRSEIWLFFDDINTVIEDTKFSDKGIELLFSSLRYSTHNAKIIVTSRILPKLGNGESFIDVVEDEEKQHLNGLNTNFAVDYLIKNRLDSVEPDKLKELADGVDGHPLSLKLLIGLVNKFGVQDTLEDLTRYKTIRENTIRKTRKLFDKLAGNEKELLERISVYRQAETMHALENMFTDHTPIDAVDNLIDESLLENDHKGKYWLHPLVQEFSYDDLENKKEVHKFAMDYYLSLLISKKPAKKEDIQTLIEAHYHACMAEEYDLAFNIIFDNNLYEYLDLWGDYTVLIDLYSKLLPQNHFGKETLLKDKINHGIILGNLGIVYSHLGEPRKAIEYYAQALKISREIKDRRREGAWLGNLGLEYIDLGEPRKAIEYYEQALKISREIGDRRGEGDHIGNLGLAYYHLGEPRKAIGYNEQALKISREIEDRREEGNRLGNLGSIYYCLGELRKAIEYYEQALKIAQEIGDRRREGNHLGNLGNAYCDLGELRKAIEYYEQALKIAQEIRDRRGEGNHLENLGIVYFYLDEPKKAVEYHEQALKIAQEIGDRRVENTVLGNLGIVYRHLGKPRKAIGYHEQALKIAQEIGDRQGEGNHLGNLGIAYKDLGEPRKAIEYHEQALKIAQEIEDQRLINFCERNLEGLKDLKTLRFH